MTAIEVDRHLAPVLRAVVEPRRRHGRGGRRHARSTGRTCSACPSPAGRGRWWPTCPYNIATPLRARPARAAPAIERMLVLVQLEVGERLAAGPGTKAYGIPSVKLGWWADATIVGKVPASVFIPQPRVESALVEIRRHPPAGTEAQRTAVFDLVETGFNQRRKMLRRSLAAKVEPGDLEAAGIRPEARAEELTLARLDAPRGRAALTSVRRQRPHATVFDRTDVASWRAPGRPRPGQAHPVAADHRRPGRRLPPDRRRDGGDRPRRHAHLHRRRRSRGARRRPGRAARTTATSCAGRWPPSAAPRTSWSTSASPRAPASAAARPTPPPCCAGRSHRPRRGRRARRRRALLPGRRSGARHRHRGGARAAPVRAAHLHPPHPAGALLDARRLRARGTTSAAPTADGPNDLEPAALEVAPELAAFRDRLGDVTGLTPVLAGSGSTWFVEGAHEGDGFLGGPHRPGRLTTPPSVDDDHPERAEQDEDERHGDQGDEQRRRAPRPASLDASPAPAPRPARSGPRRSTGCAGAAATPRAGPRGRRDPEAAAGGPGAPARRSPRRQRTTRPERATTASRKRRSVAEVGCAWGRPATCRRPCAASGCASASSCASSCACACGAS